MNIDFAPDLSPGNLSNLIETRAEIEQRLLGAWAGLKNTQQLCGAIDQDVYNSKIATCQTNIDFWQSMLMEAERQIRQVIDLSSIDHDGRIASHARVICRLTRLIEGIDRLTTEMDRRTQTIIISLSQVGEHP